VQTGAGELLRCWKGRWAETSVVLMVGGMVITFLVGAVALVHELLWLGASPGGSALAAVATAGGARTWRSNRTDYGPVLFADLDGDGRLETVTGVGVLDGATGQERWENLRSYNRAAVVDGQPRAVVVGPDLDGDGWRDVFVAFVVDGQPFGHPPGARVLIAEVRSGKDGRALWRSVEPLPADGPSRHPPTLHTLQGVRHDDGPWGQSLGPDRSGAALFWQCAPGTPGFFVVNVDVGRPGFDPDAVGRAFLFSADTGRLAHVWPGVTAEGVADLDGDGLADLYGRGGGKLYAIRGTKPEVWRRPGVWSQAWPNERMRDLQHKFSGGPLYFAPPLPVGDLDGDGVADVLLFRPSGSSSGPKEPVLQAYSGKDGRRLWQYDPPHLFDENGNYGAPEGISVYVCQLLHCVDLNGDGRPEVVFAYGGFSRKGWGDSRLVILNGGTGRVRWQQEGLSDSTPHLVSQGTSGGVALVVKIEGEFRALDGASGKPIRTWSRKSEHPKELTPVPWPEDGSRAEFFRPCDLADVTCCRIPVPAEPLTFDFSGIDPRLTVPLPWAERSPQRWLPALGAGLAYLALVVGFALARRWRLVLLLLAWMVVLPAVAMWQFDEAYRLLPEERRDWSGWYWFWPDRLSCWAGWETLTNPLVGASAWFVLWVIVRRPWRSRTARTGG